MTPCPDCGRRRRLYLVSGNQEALCLDCLWFAALMETIRPRELGSTGEARSRLSTVELSSRGRHGFGEHVPVGRGLIA